MGTTSVSTLSTATSYALLKRFRSARQFTEKLCETLSEEDCMIQSMPDASPTRWHLAHTTWFFETFVLREHFGENGFRPFDESFTYLFNSYYNTIGQQYPRAQRGLISRPGLALIRDYRQRTDELITQLLESDELSDKLCRVLRIGIEHEQQHQELLLTDIKHGLSCNPCYPVYREDRFDETGEPSNEWIEIESGVYEIGHGGDGFAYDNETPRHQVYLNDFRLAAGLVTCGEFMDFMADSGYQRPEFWLSMGWQWVQENSVSAPLYWEQRGDHWHHFTLNGLAPVERDWPICNVSLFEADAFARWSGKRLPTEFEWEIAAGQMLPEGMASEPFADNLLKAGRAVHPTRSPRSLSGAVWQWTSSSYQAYPGYKAPEGAIGEYNGKFMCNQYVLRGGSVATSSHHIRVSYRNFFPAETRWQFSGIRLAE